MHRIQLKLNLLNRCIPFYMAVLNVAIGFHTELCFNTSGKIASRIANIPHGIRTIGNPCSPLGMIGDVAIDIYVLYRYRSII